MHVTCRNAVQLYEKDSGIIEKKYGLKKDTFLHIAASYNRWDISTIVNLQFFYFSKLNY